MCNLKWRKQENGINQNTGLITKEMWDTGYFLKSNISTCVPTGYLSPIYDFQL